jgi:hypothetical protein
MSRVLKFAPFLERRTRPDGKRVAWCSHCGGEMTTTTEMLIKEYGGYEVFCARCRPTEFYVHVFDERGGLFEVYEKPCVAALRGDCE